MLDHFTKHHKFKSQNYVQFEILELTPKIPMRSIIPSEDISVFGPTNF